MKLLIPFVLVLLLQAQSPDLKRNQKVQRLASEVLKSEHAYDSEMKSWMADCAVKGLELHPVAGNLMDCVQKQTPVQPPRPAPAKPEAKQ